MKSSLGLNTIAVLDSLKAKRDDFIIMGGVVRGEVTDSYTRHDVAHIVTSNSELLMDVTLLAKQRVFNVVPSNNLNGAPLPSTLDIVSAKFSKDISETANEESYLVDSDFTDNEEIDVPYSTHDNIFVDSRKPGLVNPDMALLVYDYSVGDMKFRLHFISKGDELKYIASIKPELDITTNYLYEMNNKIIYLNKEAEDDLRNQQIKHMYSNYSLSEQLIQLFGWKYDEREVRNNRRIRKTIIHAEHIPPQGFTYNTNITIQPTTNYFTATTVGT